MLLRKIIFSSYIKNSFKSIIGAALIYSIVPILNLFSKNKKEIWNSKGKVLIIGRGPSLSKLNQKTIDSHDVVIFLNLSIIVAKKFKFKNQKIFLFSWDYRGIETTYRFSNNLSKNIILVICPVHFWKFGNYVKAYFKFTCPKIFLLPYPKLTFFENEFTPKTFISYGVLDVEELLPIRFPFKLFIPQLPYTIALNVIYILLECDIDAINLIGCDFGGIEYSNILPKEKMLGLNTLGILKYFEKLVQIGKKRNILIKRIF